MAKRDLAEFGAARLRDQVFDAVLNLWRRRHSEGWTQKQVAEAIGRDRGWVSKNLSGPGNWTLKTAGAFIQALDGEAQIHVSALEEPPEDRSNYDAYDGYTAPKVEAKPRSIMSSPTGDAVARFNLTIPRQTVIFVPNIPTMQSVIGRKP